MSFKLRGAVAAAGTGKTRASFGEIGARASLGGATLLGSAGRGGAMAAQRGNQRVGLGVGQIVAADEAGEGRAAAVELEAVALERIERRARGFEKELVGLDRRDEAQPRQAGDPSRDARRRGVGGLRQA